MTEITPEVVQEAWHHLASATPTEIGYRIERLRQAQPILAGYVRAVEEGIFANDERGELTFFTLWAFDVCRRTGRATREIDEATIEAMLSENERLLIAVEAAPVTDVMSTAASWTQSYPHIALLSAILHYTMQGDMENPRRVDDYLGLLVLHVKTIIDCLALV